jgi:hypothetical protein
MSAKEAYIAETSGERKRRYQIFRLDGANAPWMFVLDEYDATGSAAPVYDAIEPTLAEILPHVADKADQPLSWRRSAGGRPVDLEALAAAG